MTDKKKDAFETAIVVPVSSHRPISHQGRIEFADDKLVIGSIDSFSLAKRELLAAKEVIENLIRNIRPFGIKMFVKGALAGTYDNPILKGTTGEVRCIIKDQYCKPTEDIERLLLEQGIRPSDIICEVSTYSINPEILEDNILREKIGEALAQIHPNVLIKITEKKIKKGTIRKLAQIGDRRPDLLEKLIEILGCYVQID